MKLTMEEINELYKKLGLSPGNENDDISGVRDFPLPNKLAIGTEENNVRRDVKLIRDYKDMLYGCRKNTVYLDNAASTLAFTECVKTAEDFLKSYGSIHRGAGLNSEKSTEAYENARETIRELIGCKDEETVIFTANTTDGINKFALMYDFQPGDYVLISDIEHSANTLPWYKRAHVALIKSDDTFHITPEAVEEALKKHPNTKIVALGAASNITGYLIDCYKIKEICHKYGALFFLDASQYAPHRQIRMDMADVIAYCGHKMYAPFGAGVLAGNVKYFERAGLSLTGGGNVLYVYEDGTPIYKAPPAMHEAGTANGVGAVTLAKAHQILYQDIGEAELIKHNRQLTEAMYKVTCNLRKYGYDVFFTDSTLEEDADRMPIMVLNNREKSNKETVKWLNKGLRDGNPANVFVREGAFCAYRIIEKMYPELKSVEPKVDSKIGELDSRYSLIRLSGGLSTSAEDIYKTAYKLAGINIFL